MFILLLTHIWAVSSWRLFWIEQLPAFVSTCLSRRKPPFPDRKPLRGKLLGHGAALCLVPVLPSMSVLRQLHFVMKSSLRFSSKKLCSGSLLHGRVPRVLLGVGSSTDCVELTSGLSPNAACPICLPWEPRASCLLSPAPRVAAAKPEVGLALPCYSGICCPGSTLAEVFLCL